MALINGEQVLINSIKTLKNIEAGGDGTIDGGLTVTGTSSLGHITMASSKNLVFASTTDHGVMRPSTALDQFQWCIGSGYGRQLVLCDSTGYAKDYDHAVPTDFTLYLHSIRDPDESNTEWLSQAHDGSNAVNSVGFGGHTFTTAAQKARGTMTLTGFPAADEIFTINATAITAKADGSGDIDHFTIGGTAAATVTNIVATLAECTEAANLTAWDGAGDTVVIEWDTAGVAGNAIVFTEGLANCTIDGAGTLGTTHAAVDAATLLTVGEDKAIAVPGTLTVAGLAYMGNHIILGANSLLRTTTTGGGVLTSNTAQTVNCPQVLTGSVANHWLFCEWNDRNFDFEYPQQPTPTFCLRSDNQNITEFLALAHDGDDGIYRTDHGGHVFKTGAQKARGTITFPGGVPIADETFVIDAQTFTWKADGSGNVDHVTIGADAPGCVTNLVATFAECTNNADFTAWDGAGDTVVVEWGTAGVAGNAIVSTEACTNMTWDAVTLGTTHAAVDAATLMTIPESGGITVPQVTKSIDIENANLGKGTSAATEVIVGNFTAWEFGVNDDAVFDIPIPHDIAAGTDMTVNVVWQVNEAGGDEVQWQIDYESIPADSSQAIGGAGTQVKSGDIVVPATVRFLTETSMTIVAANIAANEHCGITLTRIAIDDGVAPGNEPGVVDVHIEYISDKLGETI